MLCTHTAYSLVLAPLEWLRVGAFVKARGDRLHFLRVILAQVCRVLCVVYAVAILLVPLFIYYDCYVWWCEHVAPAFLYMNDMLRSVFSIIPWYFPFQKAVFFLYWSIIAVLSKLIASSASVFDGLGFGLMLFALHAVFWAHALRYYVYNGTSVRLR